MQSLYQICQNIRLRLHHGFLYECIYSDYINFNVQFLHSKMLLLDLVETILRRRKC